MLQEYVLKRMTLQIDMILNSSYLVYDVRYIIVGSYRKEFQFNIILRSIGDPKPLQLKLISVCVSLHKSPSVLYSP